MVASLRGNVEHFFHLAAVYDMTADDERNRVANVEGTRHAVELANAIGAGCFHHSSSIAAAGLYKGLFREDMFDEGQELDHPYHRTKFESEKIARTQTTVPWRVYRSSIVVGDSETGQMDKIDGPYYFFTAIKLARHYLPGWFPADRPRVSATRTSFPSTSWRQRWTTSPISAGSTARHSTCAIPSASIRGTF
jgi:thioester reductase-like protein